MRDARSTHRQMREGLESHLASFRGNDSGRSSSNVFGAGFDQIDFRHKGVAGDEIVACFLLLATVSVDSLD